MNTANTITPACEWNIVDRNGCTTVFRVLQDPTRPGRELCICSNHLPEALLLSWRPRSEEPSTPTTVNKVENPTPSGAELDTFLAREIITDKELRRDLTEQLQKLKGVYASAERHEAATKLTEAVMWLGQDLGRLNKLCPVPAAAKTAEGLKF